MAGLMGINPTAPLTKINGDQYGYQNPNANQVGPNMGGPMGKNNPLPGQNYYAGAASDLANEQAGRGTGFYSDKMNYGVGDQPLQAQHSNDPMVQALQGQYSGQLDNQVNAIRHQNENAAVTAGSNEQSQAMNEKSQIYQNEVKNFNEQYAYEMKRQNLYNQWRRAKDQAEAGLYGAIFSGVGGIAGGVLGGGAKG